MSAVLFFLQAALFAWDFSTASAGFLLSSDDSISSEMTQQATVEIAGAAISIALGLAVWRGSPRGVYGAVAVSLVSLALTLSVALVEVPWFGAYAFVFLLLPLPAFPYLPLTLPISVLLITVVRARRRPV